MKDIDYLSDMLLYGNVNLFYIVTEEEDRVREEIKWLIEKNKEDKKFALYEWSLAKGIEPAVVPPNPDGNMPSNDLNVALSQIKDNVNNVNTIIFFKGAHYAFNPSNPDYAAIRKIFEMRFNCIMIFISPVSYLPIELKRYFCVIDWNLPTEKDISVILDKTVEKFNERRKEKFNITKSRASSIAKLSQGLIQDEILDIFALSLNKYGDFNEELIRSAKKQLILKSGFLDYFDKLEEMTNVGGLDELKKWLAKRKNAFGEKAAEFGLPAPRGIMLVGIPGVGKSLACKAISSAWGLPLIRLDVGRIFSRMVGSSEENVRSVLKIVEAVAPCILFIDEIEKGLSGTVSSNVSDAGTTARVVSTILSWLNDKTSSVFVAATANNISQLPPELLRKGRFDEIFFIDLPNVEEREEIFKIHLAKRNRDPKKLKLNLTTLAENTEEYSGAEIESIVISAMYDAFDANTDITQGGLMKSIEDIIPLSKTAKEDIKYLKDWVGKTEDGRGVKARFASSQIDD